MSLLVCRDAGGEGALMGPSRVGGEEALPAPEEFGRGGRGIAGGGDGREVWEADFLSVTEDCDVERMMPRPASRGSRDSRLDVIVLRLESSSRAYSSCE